MSGTTRGPRDAVRLLGAARGRWTRVLGDLLGADWAITVFALLITIVLFVLTRDDVTKRFTVPLRVTADPDRVLLTPVPETIAVEVRGPWTRVNRLNSADLGAAALDLREAEPGPLTIDRASIVMPRGVVLADVDYDEVDLRFEPVIERDVPVMPLVVGEPAADYRLGRVRSEPSTVRIRGGRSAVLGVGQLSTEGYDLREAAADVTVSLTLARPPAGVSLLGEGSEPMRVRVLAEIEPRIERVELRVAIGRDPALAERAGVPAQLDVALRGPAPAFRELERRGAAPALVATAAPVEGATDRAQIRVGWAVDVPASVRAVLSFEPAESVVELPPLPAAPVPSPPVAPARAP